jgi:hypothetical protein
MIDVSKILKDRKSLAFFSFIIGLGVSILLFHKPFGYKNFLSVPVSDIEGKPVRVNDKCYSYVSEDVPCLKDQK